MMDWLTIAIGQINTRDVAVLVSRWVVNGMTVGSHGDFGLKPCKSRFCIGDNAAKFMSI